MQARKQPGPGHGAPGYAPSGRPNSIGLAAADLALLLDQIDLGAKAVGSRRRNFVRWPFRHCSVPLTIDHPGGNTVTLHVACRNLSCGGMSVLHNGYVYPGSRCAVTLPHPRHGPSEIRGRAVRCVHVRGTIHEIGIAFDTAIAAKDFVDADPLANWFSLEHVAAQSLRGRLVLACPSALDARLMQHFLRASAVGLVHAATLDEALAAAESACDLVIADLELGDRGAADLIVELRARANWAPVVVLLPDQSSATRARAAAVGASGYLVRPVSQESLLRAVGEFLLVAGTSMLVSSLPREHPNRPLADAFLAQLGGYAERAEGAAARGDMVECRSICLAVQGSAPSLGFERLGEIAGAAACRIVPGSPAPPALTAFLNACRAGAPEQRPAADAA